MKIIIPILVTALAAPYAYGFTYFQKGQSPSELLQKGNRYQNKNIYNNNDNLNAYSTFQNVYDPRSVRNNPDRYGYHVKTYNNKHLGTISPQSNHQNSITNPYGTHGNVYQKNHPSQPYKSQKWDNPYSNVQNPYYGKSFRNNQKYGLHLKDSNGKAVGTNHPHAAQPN